MRPASAPPERATDLASSVLLTMRQMGVVALPRNYEIFYEALSGSNPELSLEVVSLSKRPTQEDLDRIGIAISSVAEDRLVVSERQEVRDIP